MVTKGSLWSHTSQRKSKNSILVGSVLVHPAKDLLLIYLWPVVETCLKNHELQTLSTQSKYYDPLEHLSIHTVWTINDVLSRSIPFYWVSWSTVWIDSNLRAWIASIRGYWLERVFVWIDSRRHWWFTLYVLNPAIVLNNWDLIVLPWLQNLS